MVKRFYARTNKNNAVHQMTRLERRNHVLARQARAISKQQSNSAQAQSTLPTTKRRRHKKTRLDVDFSESEPLPPTPLEYHHHISASRNFPVYLQSFILTNKDDPVMKV